MNSPNSSLPPILQALQGASPRGTGRRARSRAAQAARHFQAEGSLPLGSLDVAVQAQAALAAPLPPADARALLAASTPARHGRRSRTVLDTRVRDTGELPPGQLALQWAPGALRSLQADVAHALGLRDVELRLHNLLVYGPGQFFKPHQDTEQHPGMVGTLVLLWPSPHIGGELVIRHGRDEARFASQHLSVECLRWCAFYADCRHEVLPVTEGFRVVLGFDLVLPPPQAVPEVPVSPALLAALRAHFHPADGPNLRPWVFMLDHEYSERGLHWPLLKGADRAHVEALRAAAGQLGLTVHLALAELHEQWTARFDGVYDDEDRAGDDAQPDELIDRSIVLNHWVDADDRALKRDALQVHDDDLASFRSTDDTHLVDQAYEGYMGNYGQTLEYWYRRAALVIQTAAADQASRWVTDFDAALAEAQGLARAGRGVELDSRLHTAAAPLRTQREQRGRRLLAPYAQLAAALTDDAQALALMQGFAWTDFQPADARVLPTLATRRGPAWTQALLDAWALSGDYPRKPGWHAAYAPGADAAAARPPWPQDLPGYVQRALGARLDAALVDHLLQCCLQALKQADDRLAPLSPAQRDASFEARLQAVCGLALASGLSSAGTALSATLVRHVLSQPPNYPPARLRPLVQHLRPAAPSSALALRSATLEALRRLLAGPERPQDDHTLEHVEWACRCADCTPVIQWAGSAEGRPLTLAMAEQRRQHVQQKLAAAGAPLACSTLRQGSPYKLVVTKPGDLHERRRDRRRCWEADLAALMADVPPP